MIAPPHAPAAVNVNGCETIAPLVDNTPYVCAPLGATTPLVANKVATRFVVFNPPIFRNAKSTCTVSPGPIAPLVGVQLPASSVLPLITMTDALTSGARASSRFCPAGVPQPVQRS